MEENGGGTQLSPGTLHFVQQERQLVVNNEAVV